ncbi:MAG: alpha/beta fold hydrolase [Gammaproteobacteria bacterium]|nr:alpha/beta fold hydrolase [Gammaproteobacteria bacterium]
MLIATTACSKPAPKGIEELQAASRDTELTLVGEIEGGPGFDAFLYAYDSAGLRVYAMVAMPHAPKPDGGFPVLIANHGHHPDPPNYGITADGKDWRPGDYYRRIPELFVARKFAVVMPDYRGHNTSEGFEFTEGMLESSYYTEDVLNLMAGLDALPNIDTDMLFMWGHSMGGEVTLRALLATDRLRAASMWSSVGGDIWDQSYYYSRYEDPQAPDSSETPKSVIERLRGRIAELDEDFDYSTAEPLLHLDYLQTPIIIQHAIGDRGAAYKWSERLAKELYLRGKRYEFISYAGDDHLFQDTNLETAVDRDAEFFRSVTARPDD